MGEEMEVIAVIDPPKFKEQPEPDPLAKKWQKRIESAQRHYSAFHKRIRHNRQLVSGLDWKKEPDGKDFYMHRANLIHGTITGILPNLYAQNPEISVSPVSNPNLKLLSKTIETVTNRYLDDAKLKQRAKATVRAAMTCSFGVLKVTWQQDIEKNPIIIQRIQDAQDNLKAVERLMMELEDESARSEQEAIMSELEQTIAALSEQVEVVKSEGLVIDRVLTENILVDPSVQEFADYINADWIVHVVPMSRQYAEGLYGYKLDKAKAYNTTERRNDGRLFGKIEETGEDAQVCIYEIWDKQSQRVYTMADGCEFWLRDPYSPDNVGERWYPFFLLPFQMVDGRFIGPSIVDLTERLQDEHNTARDRYNEHRDLIRPGYIASAEINKKAIDRFKDSELGEIVLIDSEGKPINQAIIPKQYPPIDPAVYDTSPVRVDWEMVTGMQDAARSTVVKPKTATEANIMQQQLSARVSEFRDQIEDFLKELAQYTAEILLLTISAEEVERITGPNAIQSDPMTGLPVITKQVYDWPSMPRSDIFNLVQLTIRAGTTGAPDKMEAQENWLKMIQVIQPLIAQIMQLQAQRISPAPLVNILKETISRFDDRLEVEDFIPQH